MNAEKKAELQKDIDFYSGRLVMLQNLKDNDGYVLLIAAFTPGLERAVEAAVEAKDPYEAAKKLGTIRVLKDLTTWADREIETCKAYIQTCQEEGRALEANALEE